MRAKPSPEYLEAIGQSVITWSDLNLQSAIYVYRAKDDARAIDIDAILEQAVETEGKFVQAMRQADMPTRLVDQRIALSKTRNAIAHSIITRNTDGTARLWRPEHNNVAAHPLHVAEIQSFISEARTLTTSLLAAEVQRFGQIRTERGQD